MLSGIDVSRWEPADQLDYPAIYSAGYKFVAARCTVGNYYTDSHFTAHINAAWQAGLLVTPYLVVAPAAYDGGPRISVQQHMDYFLAAMKNYDSDLPWVLDCELTRGQSKAYITSLIAGIVEACNLYQGRYPIIYTRASWWDLNTYADPLWSKCPLWAARYSSLIPGPWSFGSGQITASSLFIREIAILITSMVISMTCLCSLIISLSKICSRSCGVKQNWKAGT
jgi:lysozyme